MHRYKGAPSVVRVLNCIHTVAPAPGGDLTHVYELTNAALNAGHRFEVLTVDAPDQPYLKHWRAPVHALGPALGRLGYSPRVAPWLRANRHNYDAVVLHGLWRHLGVAVRQALRGSGVPYFVQPHGSLNQWGMTHGGVLKTYAKYGWWFACDYPVCRDSDGLLFTCADEAEQARLLFSGRMDGHIVSNGVAEPPLGDAYSARALFEQHPELAGKDLLLFLGRFHRVKGLDNLVRGLAIAGEQASNVHVLLGGPESTETVRDVAEMARNAGVLDRFTFLGTLHGSRKWSALRASDAVILPSRSEASPYTLIESLSCGTPVLTTRAVGIQSDLEDSRCALIDEASPEGVARMLRSWSAKSVEEREAMSRAALRLFDSRYRSSATLQRLCEVIAAHRPVRNERRRPSLVRVVAQCLGAAPRPRTALPDSGAVRNVSRPGLSVVIPSRTASNLEACIQAVRTHQPEARIIVIDDGLDRAAAIALMSRARVLRGAAPFVYARNCNQGIEAAGTDDVILLNDDALLETADGFAALQQAVIEQPDYGIIAATTNITGCTDQLPRRSGVRSTREVAFVCVLIPRRTIDAVGLLDERFTAYGGEDVDYCRRVRLAGWKVGVHDGCYVDHASLRSAYRGSPRTPGNVEAGLELLREKWGAGSPYC